MEVLQLVMVSELLLILVTTNHFFVFLASAIVCSDLSIENGIVLHSSGSTNNRPVNTMATHTCNSGYTLSGGTNPRTCGSDGQWSGSAPVCQGRYIVY